MNKLAQPDLGTHRIRTDFVPSRYFTGPDVPHLEKMHLWSKIWHIACREEEIPNVGDFVNYEDQCAQFRHA